MGTTEERLWLTQVGFFNLFLQALHEAVGCRVGVVLLLNLLICEWIEFAVLFLTRLRQIGEVLIHFLDVSG